MAAPKEDVMGAISTVSYEIVRITTLKVKYATIKKIEMCCKTHSHVDAQ
jgi:hypothetical protein